MKSHLSTSAPSPLGQWLALTAVAVPLILVGMYLALGDITSGDTSRMQGIINSVFSSEKYREAGRQFSQYLVDHFKNYTRLELLVYYGIAIFAAFVLQRSLSRFLRSYRFVFYRSRGILERRALWLVIPLWLAAWILFAFFSFLIFQTTLSITLWFPLWLVLGILAALVAAALGYSWFPDQMCDVLCRFTLFKRSFYLPVAVAIIPGAALLLILFGLSAGFTWKIGIPFPIRLLLALFCPLAVLLPCWLYAPELLRRSLCVPGMKKRVPFSQVKRLEIITEAEGGTSLIVTLGNGWSWTIKRGSIRVLQRAGTVLACTLGLSRRDLVTWT